MGDELGDMIAITRAAVTRFPYPILIIVGAAARLRSRAVRSRTDRSASPRFFDAELLNVLYLLTNALEFCFQLDDILGKRGIVCLRADGIGLATELLE